MPTAVSHLEETYGGGQIPNFTVTYVIEVTDTNASFSPPIPATPLYPHPAILAIISAIVVSVGVLFILRKRQGRTSS